MVMEKEGYFHNFKKMYQKILPKLYMSDICLTIQGTLNL